MMLSDGPLVWVNVDRPQCGDTTVFNMVSNRHRRPRRRGGADVQRRLDPNADLLRSDNRTRARRQTVHW